MILFKYLAHLLRWILISSASGLALGSLIVAAAVFFSKHDGPVAFCVKTSCLVIGPGSATLQDLPTDYDIERPIDPSYIYKGAAL